MSSTNKKKTHKRANHFERQKHKTINNIAWNTCTRTWEHHVFCLLFWCVCWCSSVCFGFSWWKKEREEENPRGVNKTKYKRKTREPQMEKREIMKSKWKTEQKKQQKKLNASNTQTTTHRKKTTDTTGTRKEKQKQIKQTEKETSNKIKLEKWKNKAQ